jgi:predicted KAP-like P-loop ATPase
VAEEVIVKLGPEATPSSGRFLSDAPGGVDRFGRSHFAGALARALLLPPDSDGLVIGIEGAWGSGKTFVINQIQTILLESTDSPILVDFNPWVTAVRLN